MRISEVRGDHKSVLDHVVDNHGSKVSLIWMANNYLDFTSKFGRDNLFLGEPLKILPGGLYTGHVLFFGVSVW